MEKIPAACAMEWSIELEKGLRSKKPGQCIDAIKQIAYKLQQWSNEPSITMAISDMYGMVPGEDRLFANTILLRLTDAFCYGDVEVRRCILKVFLVELQHISKRGKLYNGILSRKRVPNYLELIKKLKTVFDTGDLEAKSLTLRLFGCWADLAKDSTQICFLILNSMQSGHDIEVKASLFVAGCFSLLSEDFAFIVLEILISIISSIARSPDVRLAAIHALSKLRCSSTITRKAYEAGSRLLLDMSMDDLKAEMLSALSKLVSKTSLLFLEQIELLVSFLSHEHPILVKTRALRCLYILFGGGSCNFLASKSILSTLFSILDDNEFPLELQCKTLQILQKIFSNRLLVPIRETSDLFKLVEVVEIVGTSNIKKRLALRLLVDILCSMKEAGKEQCSSSARCVSSIAQSQGSFPSVPLNFSEYRPAQLISIVSSSIMDQVNSLVKEMICSCHMEMNCIKNLKHCCEPLEFKKELKILLNFILCLAQQYPSAGLVALSRMRCIVQPLVGMLNGANTEIRAIACEEVSLKEAGCEKGDRVFGPLESDGKQITAVSEILLCICRFANACLNILQGTSSITSEVLHIVKDIVNCIKQCEHSCYDSHEIFYLILHSFVMCDGFEEGKWRKLKNGDQNICWLHQECGALDFTKKMLRKGNFWEVYRAGKYSCLKGLWFAATFSFRKLIDVAKSDDYSRWIKALMLFSGAESEMKLLFFPKVGLELIRRFQFASDSDQPLSCNEGETDVCAGEGYDLNAFGENLVRIYHRMRSTEKVLEASTNLSCIFFFQRWFLHLRGKFLENVVEILGLLSSYTLAEDKFKEGTKANPINAIKLLQDTCALLCSLARVSFQLNHLARSYDHLATSFMDIDAVSFRSISRLGISCSALAFCTSFAINFLSSPTFKNIISCANNHEMFSNVKIVQDLAERLWDIDYAMASKLMHFMLVKEEIKHGFCSMAQIHSSGLFDNASLSLFQSAINGILDVQTDLEVAKDVEDLITIISRGLQLLCCFIMKWMEIPLLTPKYFFRVRPCIGSELFIYHANSEHRDELFVRPGFQLPLNLCIQLKNASSMNCASIAKIYCVLAVKASDRFATESARRLAAAQCAFQAHKGEEMVWLSEILLQFLRANSKETEKEHDVVVDNVSLLATCVCFEPNKMGLGFSTCLLNVSQLPVGSYPIKWHSCCVDDRGFYWNLIPLNSTSVFTIKN